MLSAVNALIPVFLIILLGFALKRAPVFNDAAWRGFENLCYFVLFPILLIKTLAKLPHNWVAQKYSISASVCYSPY